MSKELTKALRARASAERRVEEILKRDYPIGRAIRWLTGTRQTHYGMVTMHTFSDRIKVRNSKTDTEYFIRAAHIVE